MSTCCVYIATKMSGRDRKQMVKEAKFNCAILGYMGLTSISPVLEEKVKNEKGKLTQTSVEKLRGFWKRDKDIIAYQAHVILCDDGLLKSLGVEREYGYARFCLWKPVVTILPKSIGPNIAMYEDDIVVHDIYEAGQLIDNLWGTRYKRIKWRIRMLLRTFPKWVYRQLYQWR